MPESELPPENEPCFPDDTTLSRRLPSTPGQFDGGDPSEVPMDDHRKLFAIVRSIIGWQEQIESCLRDPSGLFADRFRIIKQLGKGGFGQVYLAADEHKDSKTYGQELALKMLRMTIDVESQGGISQSKIGKSWFQARRSTIENWIDEIHRHRNLLKMAPDGCVPIVDASVPDSKDLDVILKHVRHEPIWFAMPVYKQTLADYVDERGRDGKLPVAEAQRIMLSVARAMKRLHDFK